MDCYNIDYPKTIEQEYTIELPDGFVLNDSSKKPHELMSYYINDNLFVVFKQLVVDNNRSKLDVLIDNENSILEYYKDDNGILYSIYTWENSKNCEILWEAHGYIFVIAGNLDKYETLNLCNHIKLK